MRVPSASAANAFCNSYGRITSFLSSKQKKERNIVKVRFEILTFLMIVLFGK